MRNAPWSDTPPADTGGDGRTSRPERSGRPGRPAEERARLIDEEGRPTARYRAYLEHQARYDDAVRAREEAHAAARTDPRSLQQWPIDARAHRERVEAALTRWQALGFKTEVETALATITDRASEPRPETHH